MQAVAKHDEAILEKIALKQKKNSAEMKALSEAIGRHMDTTLVRVREVL